MTLLVVVLWCTVAMSSASFQVLNRVAYAQPRCIQGFTPIDATRFAISEGYWGLSRLLHVDIATGRILKSQDIAQEIFAEGIAIRSDQIWMLTYKNSRVLRFDLESLRPLTDAPTMLAGEGWGLAYDAPSSPQFVVSNGSNMLSFRDPLTFAETRLLPVSYPNGTRVTMINELELVRFGGTVPVLLANIWFAEIIVGIDPTNGTVLFVENTRALNMAPASLPAASKLCGSETTNGIAWHEQTNRLWLFGKYWGHIVEVKLEWNGQSVGGGLATTTSSRTATASSTTTTTSTSTTTTPSTVTTIQTPSTTTNPTTTTTTTTTTTNAPKTTQSTTSSTIPPSSSPTTTTTTASSSTTKTSTAESTSTSTHPPPPTTFISDQTTTSTLVASTATQLIPILLAAGTMLAFHRFCVVNSGSRP